MEIWYTGTLIVPTGGDTDCYGDPCEPGTGFVTHSVWVDPDGMKIYSDQIDVTPDRLSVDVDMANWAIETLNQRLGRIEHIEIRPYDGSAFALSADWKEVDPFTGEQLNLTAHMENVPLPVLREIKRRIMGEE